MRLILLLLFFFSSLHVLAADSLPALRIIYKMRVQVPSGEYIRGFLKEIEEDKLIYTEAEVRYGAQPDSTDKVIRFTEITTLRLRRKGAGGRTALTAGGIGAGVGAVTGLALGNDRRNSFLSFTAAQKAALLAYSFGTSAAMYGAIISIFVYSNYYIDGDKKNFENMRTKVLEKTYRNYW